jgi:hypothetical protein
MCHHAPIVTHRRLDRTETAFEDAHEGDGQTDADPPAGADPRTEPDPRTEADERVEAGDAGDAGDPEATGDPIGELDVDEPAVADEVPSFASAERSVDVDLLDRDDD